MTDSRIESVDLTALDLTKGELYRYGFPHETFTALRREAPVHWQAVSDDFTENDDEGFWVLSKYGDIQAANRDSELFSAFDGPLVEPQPRDAVATMLVSHGRSREHNRQRRLISAGFTPRMVGPDRGAGARQWAVKIVEEALERGTCNFVQKTSPTSFRCT